MPKARILLIVILGIAALYFSQAGVKRVQASTVSAVQPDDDSSLHLQEKETIQKTFTLSSEHKILEVDNVFGSIDVVGGEGNQVQLVVNKTIRAESKDRMEAAKKEVTLDITDQPDFLKLYVNGPFRCNCNDGISLMATLECQ